jgi:hypothetical protein
MTATSQTPRLNCATKLLGTHCHHQCGQRAATGRFIWHSLLHDMPHSIFHVDRTIVSTLVRLIRHPGRAINGYPDGQRARYINSLTPWIPVTARTTIGLNSWLCCAASVLDALNFVPRAPNLAAIASGRTV